MWYVASDMGTKHIVIILIIVVGAAVLYVNSTGGAQVPQDNTVATPQESGVMSFVSDDADGTDLITDITFDEEEVRAVAAAKTPILFFYASWCSTCRSLVREIQDRSAEFPDHVAILKVSYDDEKELRRRYQVTRQHTIIILDEDLNATQTLVGGNVDDILDLMEA